VAKRSGGDERLWCDVKIGSSGTRGVGDDWADPALIVKWDATVQSLGQSYTNPRGSGFSGIGFTFGGLVTRMQGAVGADGRANGRGSHTVALGGPRPAVQTFIAGQCPWIQELLEMSLRVGSSLSPCSFGGWC
jgi:hypothetical protein